MHVSGLQEDEHLIVWMRTAALQNFRKLWGRIDSSIPAGANVTVLIQNRYGRTCSASLGPKSRCIPSLILFYPIKTLGP